MQHAVENQRAQSLAEREEQVQQERELGHDAERHSQRADAKLFAQTPSRRIGRSLFPQGAARALDSLQSSARTSPSQPRPP